MYQIAYIYLLLAGNLRQMSLGDLSFQAAQHSTVMQEHYKKAMCNFTLDLHPA